MINQIKILFEAFGFEVQDTSFERQIHNSNLKPLNDIQLPNTDASNLLVEYPHLFVYHPKLKPGEAAFFVYISDKKIQYNNKILRLLLTLVLMKGKFKKPHYNLDKINNLINHNVTSLCSSLGERIQSLKVDFDHLYDSLENVYNKKIKEFDAV